MRISDWSSDVCSSDLSDRYPGSPQWAWESEEATHTWLSRSPSTARQHHRHGRHGWARPFQGSTMALCGSRSEEHTSELQSLVRISYAVFCLKKKNKQRSTRYKAAIKEIMLQTQTTNQ